MTENKTVWQKYQNNLSKALDFLNNGGDFRKATTLLVKANDYLPERFKQAGNPVATLLAENEIITKIIDSHVWPLLKNWQQDGRTIYLCFYAVRDNDDNYLGALETVQDITKLKAITGTKTLENRS